MGVLCVTGKYRSLPLMAGILLSPDLSSRQPVDPDLTAIAALSTTAFGRAILALADASALQTAAGESAFVKTIMDDADAAAVRTTLGITSGGLTLIDRQTSAGDKKLFTFSSIPQTYEDLVVVFMGRVLDSVTSAQVYFRANNDSGNNYEWEKITAAATMSQGATTAQSLAPLGTIPGASGTANKAGSLVATFPGYARSVFHKTYISENFGKASSLQTQWIGGQWASASAITQLDVMNEDATGNFFTTGTVCSLYGRA